MRATSACCWPCSPWIARGLIREGQGPAMTVVADRGIDGERLAPEIRTALLS